MRIIHLVFSSAGGAGIAANNLNMSLKKNGVDSTIRYLIDSSLEKRFYKYRMLTLLVLLDNFIIKKNLRLGLLSLLREKVNYFNLLKLDEYDIIHLHWTPGFLSLKKLAKCKKLDSKKFVVTLHDTWFFTGGCHYPGECNGYITNCTRCPIVKNVFSLLPQNLHFDKKIFFDKFKPEIIAPSQWMSNMAQKSSILHNKRIHIIENIVLVNKFYKMNKNTAKSFFRINPDSLVIGLCAQDLSDPRKGIEDIINFFILNDDRIPSNTVFFLVGANFRKLKLKMNKNILIINKHFESEDADINTAFNTFDVYLHNAYEDNAPNTVKELINLEVPIVARNAGGVAEMLNDYPRSLTFSNFNSALNAVGPLIRNELASNSGPNPDNTTDRHIQLYKKVYIGT